MAIKLEAGKKYVDRNGTVHGPLFDTGGSDWPFVADVVDRAPCWQRDGVIGLSAGNGMDLVAEWQDEPTGPVRTVTRREIVPGAYDRLDVYAYPDRTVGLRFLLRNGEPASNNYTALTANELRSAAMVLSQLAEALDDNKDAGK